MERIYDYLDVLQWLLEVARGLRYLHSRSLTHRSGCDLGRVMHSVHPDFVQKWSEHVMGSFGVPEEPPYLLSRSFQRSGGCAGSQMLLASPLCCPTTECMLQQHSRELA